MIILGISDGDDAGSCIVRDGKLVSAVNEERLNRKKQSIGFPYLSIGEVLRISNVDASEINGVAVAAFREDFNVEPIENRGWFGTSDDPGKRVKKVLASALSPYLGRYGVARKFYHRMQVRISRDRKIGIPRLLNQMGILAPIRYFNHHLCHALPAYYTSGFDNAVTITLDGGGDGCCSHVYLNKGNSFEQLFALDSFHSIGNFYSYVTHISGFKASIHEGKITGLAALGQPIYKEKFAELIAYREGEIVNLGNLYHQSAIRKIRKMLPEGFKLEDLAASIQWILEDIAVQYITYWIKRSGAKKVALSGGVFANVKLNQMIASIPDVEEIYIFPHMGDGGLSVGAAYAMYREAPDRDGCHIRIENVYLGAEYSDHEIQKELDTAGISYGHKADVEKDIAGLLADGKVVARFNGAMEFGPRALGNRSILYQGTDPTVNDWLNKKLDRTEFMPFAPAMLPEYVPECFHMIKAGAHAAKFMTITFDCTKWLREKCPAVVHVDGTARPQLVFKQESPSFYKIIDEYRKLSGIPAIINTSFNMHEEPIVCTPKDAIRSFQQGQLDCLAIGNFLVTKSLE